VEAQATITSNEQLKIEFESIKSLINVSSGEDGGGKPALSDFRKLIYAIRFLIKIFKLQFAIDSH